MHGGVTMMMSASEVHLPGRPRDRAGVKALALAAQRAYATFRPGGVKVLAGSLILEPDVRPEDFEELAAEGVWLAKVGFGAFERPADAAPLVRAAQAAGFVVMNHTGGASIPGSAPVSVDDVLALGCDIVGHANGGPTALPDAGPAATLRRSRRAAARAGRQPALVAADRGAGPASAARSTS